MRIFLRVALVFVLACRPSTAGAQPAAEPLSDVLPAPSVPGPATAPPSDEPHPAASGKVLAEVPAAMHLRMTDLEARLAELEARAKSAPGGTELDAHPPSKDADIYGFLDFTGLGIDSSGSGYPDPAPALYFGNLNVYLDFRPDPEWRVLSEVRFSLEPNGQETQTPSPQGVPGFGRTSTEVVDTVSGQTWQYGAIGLERVHIDWTPTPNLGVRTGVFLTPYGIWNLDHGTPVLIPARPPVAILASPFPRQQLGVQLFGRTTLGSGGLDYGLYASNGRSAVGLQRDLDQGKAFGAQLRVDGHLGAAAWKAGVAAYHGRYVDTRRGLEPSPPRLTERESVAAQETTLGLDARLKWDRLELFGEALHGRADYEDGKRPLSNTSGAPAADYCGWSGDLLGAVRLPLEPLDLRHHLGADLAETGTVKAGQQGPSVPRPGASTGASGRRSS